VEEEDLDNMKLAAEPIQNKALNVQFSSGTEFLGKFLPNLIGLSLVIGVVLFLFIMLIGAIQWITSGNDKGGIEAARGKITNAIIGLILLLSTFAIIQLIESFMGINIMTINLGVVFLE